MYINVLIKLFLFVEVLGFYFILKVSIGSGFKNKEFVQQLYFYCIIISEILNTGRVIL